MRSNKQCFNWLGQSINDFIVQLTRITFSNFLGIMVRTLRKSVVEDAYISSKLLMISEMVFVILLKVQKTTCERGISFIIFIGLK